MTTRTVFLSATGAAAAASGFPQVAAAQEAKANIVLVHGAFSDASVWRLVIPMLQRAGHRVVGVQNPLSSLADDIANTRLRLDQLSGPTVLVGHSYGGSVIGAAARKASNVRSLVYVAALAPDENESGGEYFERYPSVVFDHFVPSGPPGFVICDPPFFGAYFAHDVNSTDQATLAATQKPTAAAAFAAKPGAPAWKDVPTFYAVSQLDRVVAPALQHVFASRMNATTVDIPASHFSLLSHAAEVGSLILRAAG